MTNENKPPDIRITEGEINKNIHEGNSSGSILNIEKYKKPVIFGVMGIICLICLYLIFRPKENPEIKDKGFNATIPQAGRDYLENDKQKAYEKQLLEKQRDVTQNAMTTLSDYWQDSGNKRISGSDPEDGSGLNTVSNADKDALSSYRAAQNTVSSFYDRDDQEVIRLRQEINRLKNSSEKQSSMPVSSGINDQLELMEKSYQMAAKYLPVSGNNSGSKSQEQETVTEKKEEKFISVMPAKKGIVSSLLQGESLSNDNSQMFSDRFSTSTKSDQQKPIANAIRGIIHESRTFTGEQTIDIRLTEPMMIGSIVIPANTLLHANGKFQNSRLLLTVSGIIHQQAMHQVKIKVYGSDAMEGLPVPNSAEQNTLSEIAANMGQTSGTNIMMTQSAKQQTAADLTKGLVQGVSGYFQKKVRQPKILIKAGQEVFLISK